MEPVRRFRVALKKCLRNRLNNLSKEQLIALIVDPRTKVAVDKKLFGFTDRECIAAYEHLQQRLHEEIEQQPVVQHADAARCRSSCELSW